ncbi:FecR family protein [Sphingomonas hylomeconis]|uniref:FecR family protein n=1 Tax=Sphingomonas hylomeconis TaxID=1395958 RepID=A0ABV7SU98_9SPHN|nr:FecR domain-containing protein [Sphingomonas hylomeconis]
MPDTAHDIDEAAAAWAVRRDAAPLGAAQQAALDAWLASDPRCRGAYLRAQAGLRYIDQARVAQDIAQPLVDQPAPRPRRSWKRYAAGLAGVTAIAAAALFYMMTPLEFATGVGELRRVALVDGSTATLNTDSDLRVAFADTERRITLDRGEAWFQVAKDKHRPFVVHAGDVRVRATGTAFAVHRLADGADVVVSEGSVLAWIEGNNRPPAAIPAGRRVALHATDPAPARIELVKPAAALAWRDGAISLEGQTIAAAASEFNRYNRLQIEIADPALGRQRVVGYFQLSRPDQFARAAAQMSGAQVRTRPDRIVLTKR